MTAQETALNGEEKLYTTSKAAKLLGISPATLRLWEQRGFISPYRTPGGERRYTLKQLESLLRKQNDGRRKNLPYSISEAAKLLGVSPATLRLWEQRDFISPYRTPGGERRYNLKQLEGLLRNQNDGRRKENNNPPSFRTVPVRSMEHYRPTPRLHRFGRKLLVVGLALLLVSFVWTRTPSLTKKRLERALSPGPLNPIVDVNDALEYRVEENLVTGLRAKFPFEATSVATEFLRVTTDALFETSRFLGTVFFGDGTKHFIKPSGDASLGNLIAEKLSISGVIEAVGRFVTSLIPARDNTYDLGTQVLQWRSGYFGTSVAVGEDALLTKTQLLFTEEAAIDSEGPLNLNTINNQPIITGAGQATLGGELTVDGTGTHTFAGTLDPNQVAAFTLTGDITGLGSPNITNIDQFSGVNADFSTKVTTPEIENTGNITIGAINAAADSTVSVLNSDGTWEANLDVEGDISAGGSITCTDCLGFAEFEDALDLDASTDIALGALTLSTSGTGALNFASTGQVSFVGNLDAGAGLDVSGAALTSSAGLTVSAGGATISSGALAVNSGSITSTAATLTINAAGAVDIQDNLTADSLTTDTGGVSIAAAQSYTGAGAVTLSSGGANTLTIDTGGAAALNIGTTNQNALTLGRATINTTINGADIILGAQADAAGEAVRADRSLTFNSGTNVTITSGAQDLTANRIWSLGWTGLLSIARGGTNSSATPTAGGVAYGTGTAYTFSAAGTSGYALISGGTGAPTWTNTPSWSTLALSSAGNALTLSGAGANIAFTGAGLAQITTAASQDLALMPGGNVGIGDTSPSYMLTLDKSTLDSATAVALHSPRYTAWIGSEDSSSSYYVLNVVGGATGPGSGGSSRLYVRADGNVGIGTTGPGYPLHIANSVPSIAFEDTDGGSTTARIVGGIYSSVGNSKLSFQTQSGGGALTTHMVMSNVGNVGIGTTSPTSPESIDTFLHIYSDTHAGLVLSDGTDDWDLFVNANRMQWSYEGTNLAAFHESGGLAFGSGYQATDPGAGNMIIEGNVGIGTTNPQELLHVYDGSTDSLPEIRLENDAQVWGFEIGGDQAGDNADRFALRDHTNSKLPFIIEKGAGNAALKIQTDGDVVMTQGNVGIGTTGPGYPLDVNVTANVIANFQGNDHAIVMIDGSDGSEKSLAFNEGGSQVWMIGMDNVPAGNNNDFIIKQTNNTNAEFLIDTNGNVGIGRTPAANKLEVEGNASKTVLGDWLANSDIRIKTDIQDLENALDIVNALRPVKFRYTDEYKAEHESIEDRYYYNFIAQEFQEVFPDSVKDDGEGYLQLDAYVVRPYLVAAVQELSAKVEELEGRLAIDGDGSVAQETSDGTTEKIIAQEVEAETGIFQRLTVVIEAIFEKITAKTAEIASAVIENLAATFIKTERIEAGKVSITGPTAGSVVVPAGEAGVFVSYPKIGGDSKVFLTPEEPLPVGAVIKEGEGFEIKLKEPASSDTAVNYWIIN